MPYVRYFSSMETRAIEEAIVVALRQIATDATIDLKSAGEIQITERLVLELNRLVNLDPPEVMGFSAALLETITRGGELRSFDGTSLEKRPDLVFRRQGVLPGFLRDFCGLFVECKVVDSAHPVHLYGGQGIARFVHGEYAWAMSTGMLVGYARNEHALPKSLADHLQSHGDKYHTKAGSLTLEYAIPEGAVCVTLHGKPWTYGNGQAPGEIRLSHMWFTIA